MLCGEPTQLLQCGPLACYFDCLLLLFPCSDLDLLRVQLLEEVEAPYKAKCEAIAKVRLLLACLTVLSECWFSVIL
jgi:hypothetical protein